MITSNLQCDRCHAVDAEFTICTECDGMFCHACIKSPTTDYYICTSCDALIDECFADDSEWDHPEPDAFWKMTVISVLMWAAIASIASLLWLLSFLCA